MIAKSTNQKNAKLFANLVLKKILQLIENHNEKIDALNDEVVRSNKRYKTVTAKSDPQIETQFYTNLQNIAERLKLLHTTLAGTDKISKERRDLFGDKITLMSGDVEHIIDVKGVKLLIDQELLETIQQIEQTAGQLHKNLLLLGKESRAFCCANDRTTAHTVEKGLLDLVGYVQFWRLLSNASPLVNLEIQNRYVELQYQRSIFNNIDEVIESLWPIQTIVQIPVQVVDQTAENQRRKMADLNTRLYNQIIGQRTLRQALEMLIGLGRSQNINKAINSFKTIYESSRQEQAVQSKVHPLICNILGALYEQGRYVTRDVKKAFNYYTQSTKFQDPQGLYKIGKFIEKRMVNTTELQGKHYANRSEELRDSIGYYQRAASSGHLDAIADLGHIFQNGIRSEKNNSQSVIPPIHSEEFIIEPNLDSALKYYKLAKKEEFPRALNNLGALLICQSHKIGERVKGSNMEKGVKYLKRAVELLYGKAYVNLGKCYQMGIGVKKDIEKAKLLYTQGSELGDSSCKLQYVKCSLSGEMKLEKEALIKMFDYLRQVILSEPSNCQALYLMGIFHQKGIVIGMSPAEAFYYTNKAAELQHSLSLVKLGDYYYSGYLGSKDIDKAQLCYKKAALKGNSQAYINLGLLYEKGLVGISRQDSLQTAKDYFMEAAKLRDPNALIFLNGQCHHESVIIQQAAELGSVDAMNLLARTNKVALQTKILKNGATKYQDILNKCIQQTNGLDKQNKRNSKKSLAPVSPRLRQMLIYSPRKNPDVITNFFSPGKDIRLKKREGVRSQQYFRE